MRSGVGRGACLEDRNVACGVMWVAVCVGVVGWRGG